MSNSQYRYALDYTGENPDNKILNEIHTSSGARNGVIVPHYGAFFADSVIVRDVSTGLELKRGKDKDYIVGEVSVEPTMITGKEVCNTILAINQNAINDFSIDYQTIGGQYLNLEPVISEHSGIVYVGPVDWNNILDKPDKFPPTLHPHVLGDVYGWEYLVEALERIRQAIIMSNVPAYEYLVEWVTDRLDNFPTIECIDVLHGDPIKDVMSYGMHQLSLRNQDKHRVYTISAVRKYTRFENKFISYRILTDNVPNGVALLPRIKYTEGELTRVAQGDLVYISSGVGIVRVDIPEEIHIDESQVELILINTLNKKFDLCNMHYKGINIPEGRLANFLHRCHVFRLDQPFSPLTHYLTGK
jgi:hypothetical protein